MPAHHLVLGSVDVTLQEIAQVRVIVCFALVFAEEAGNLILLRIVRVEYRILSRRPALIIEILRSDITDRAGNWSCHLRGRVKISDALKLNNLRRLDP